MHVFTPIIEVSVRGALVKNEISQKICEFFKVNTSSLFLKGGIILRPTEFGYDASMLSAQHSPETKTRGGRTDTETHPAHIPSLWNHHSNAWSYTGLVYRRNH
jgi:hypothetical protein